MMPPDTLDRMSTGTPQAFTISVVTVLLAGVASAAQRRAGDVNGDGYDELIIAVPYEDLGFFQAGAVHALFGSATGLGTAGGGFGSQDTPGLPDQGESDDTFGDALAVGDLNGDGYGDLAVGVPFEDLSHADDGAVHVFYGSAAGFTLSGNQFWSQDSPGVPGVAAGGAFGGGLAAGDFNGDGFGDLVIGAPYETVAGFPSAGSITVLYGSAAGLGTVGATSFNLQELTGILDSYFYLGEILEAGDFDGDGRDDLAVGVPNADVGATGFTAGEIAVLMSGSGGLTLASVQIWHQDSPGMADVAESSDFFGNALAAGDFDGDGDDDLAVGVQWEDLNYPILYAGAVNMLYGGPGGLVASAQFWHQDIGSIQETAEAYDRFGTSLGAGDFDGDGRDDLAVGVPEESFSGKRAAGIVQVLYGGLGGLSDAGNQLWSQDRPGILEQAEDRDRFGSTLLAGDFNGDGWEDLVVAAPQENLSGATGAGLVHVLYGGAIGLSSLGNQLWSQASPGVPDTPEALDGFGAALD
ncbi:MAG: hypothetical protein EYC70_06425 [Planctomycetota bacterium]|nr:MAG: hypothetical protein EYC70_06425 [Planctomycetota bacterium]